ncbi:MAG: helix-turn-helix transcriptional regulator [Clostridia bacterium]|nr:helix-turn-helix transcriptional regulator [Clostridia bacterium]
MIFHQPSNSLTDYHYNIATYTDTVWDHHFHRNLELIYVLEGGVLCTVNHRVYRLTAGEFGLCLPCDIHRYEPEEHTRYWVLVFSEDYVRFFTKQIAGKTGDGFSFRCENTIEDYIKERLIRNHVHSIFTLKSCLYAVCEAYTNAVPLVEQCHGEAKVMTLIADYIRENHTKKLTLTDLSKSFGYDYNYMSRFFHKAFNMSFSDLVNIYRLETAIRLLEDTNESVTYIAYESGFQSVRNFNSVFFSKMHVTPSQYRKTARTYADSEKTRELTKASDELPLKRC